MVAPPATRCESNGTMPAKPSGPCSTPARICKAAAWRLADTVPPADDDDDDDDDVSSMCDGAAAADAAGGATDELLCSWGSTEGAGIDGIIGGMKVGAGADDGGMNDGGNGGGGSG